MTGEPYSKERQLARGERRHARHKATKAEWTQIVKAKLGPCRVCVTATSNGHDYGRVEFHHIVPRSWGGDDLADNIAPLYPVCHESVTTRNPEALRLLRASLLDAEIDYVHAKLGAGGFERLFGA